MKDEPSDADRLSTDRPLGEILLDDGAVSATHLREALDLQREHGARVGEILTARGWTNPAALLRAVATQRRTLPVDLRAEPPDETLLSGELAPLWLRGRLLPWRRAENGAVIFASDDPVRARREAPDALIRLAAPSQFEAALAQALARAAPERASARPPATLSARSKGPRWRRAAAAAAGAAFTGALIAAPGQALAGALLLLALLSLATAALRLTALAAMTRRPAPAAPASEIAVRRGPPRIALLIPLLREAQTMPILIEALEALDWPRELLEVKLILEQDDVETLEAISALAPPSFIRTVIVPPGAPRTKPRALNFALDLCEAEIIGVYDAEDRPAPDQLRKVAAMFRAQGRDLAAVQCRLTAFNARENLLTRMFTLEYAIWFTLILPGLRRLGLPVPLGGTSVFFRRSALEKLGGWDAHNVTEDADLGMRLTRHGLRAEFCDSVTEEEAACETGIWLRQRSRWIKGFMVSWLVQTRRPLEAWRAFGPGGMLAMTCLLLGGVLTAFFAPAVVTLWTLSLLGAGPAFLAQAPDWAIWALAGAQGLNWAALMAASVAACLATRRAWLIPWAALLPLYWLAASLAAALALAELAAAPTRWRKTRHGAGRIARAERAAALARRRAAQSGAKAA